MRLRHFGHTDIGLKRSHNEDAFLADPDLGLFVVADGVGGRAKGEIASRETVQLIWEWVKQATAANESPTKGPEELARLRQIVRSAIQNACYLVHSMGQLDPEHRGMSTTASALLVRDGIGIVGQVGDSRVYLSRDGHVSQLTEDHTLINYQLKQGIITADEARRSQVKNVITRAVGHHDYVEVDVTPFPLLPGDRILLCSDGLHGYLESTSDVERILEADVQEAVLEAIRFANLRGGRDNVTVLIVEILD